MSRFLLRRFITSAVLLWIVLTATFVVVQLAPGDAASLILQPRVPPEHAQRLRAIYGLDRPLAEQYTAWLSAFLRADLGHSFLHSRPVVQSIRAVWMPTFALALAAFCVQIVVGTAAGLAAALRHDRPSDRVGRALAVTLYSTPVFWLGMMSILLFGVELGWLPSGGISSPLASRWSASQRFVDQLTHLILPALTLGLPLAAYTARVVRSQIVTALDSTISQASRARGLRERTVVRHALRHALPVLIQIAGLTLPALLGGSVVVEAVFNRPGLGNTTMSAIQGRDFPLLLGVVTSGAVAVILGNLLADLALLAVDPRLRERRSGGALSL